MPSRYSRSVSRSALWWKEPATAVRFRHQARKDNTHGFRSMFTSSLTEEVSALQEQSEAVRDKIDDPMMCAKVRQFVYASHDVQELFKVDAGQLTHPLTFFGINESTF